MNWIIVSWVFVVILTAINVFIFMKVIYPSIKMMKQMGGKNGMPDMNAMMAGLGAGGKNGQPDMSAMMAQAQKMMAGMGGPGGMGGKPGQGGPDMNALMGQMNNPNMQAQMKKAMDMLAQMQKNQKR